MARLAVDAAHTEAFAAYNGIGIVKLMRRDAGFLAAHAAVASREANFCLIPEIPFELEGPRGLLAALEARLSLRRHAVLVVAEGCGASLAKNGGARDASGNLSYAHPDLDIGARLRERISLHFSAKRISVVMKYIDPSYLVRSVRANAHDSIFCDALARNAVHAAMAGKTDVLVGRLHRIFTHVPLPAVTSSRRRVDPDGPLWLAVTEATGQPRLHA
jgi:6-phosphofructokinase 1